MPATGAPGTAASATRLWNVAGIPSYLVSNSADRFADALLNLGLAWAAAQTGGALSATAVLAAGSVPRLVVLLAGGALGDRYGLLRLATLTLMVRIALMGVFAWALTAPTHPSGWVLAACAVGFGVADGAHLPAMTGLSALLVRGQMVVAAQGFVGAATEVAEILAAPAAGLLLAWRPISLAGVCTVLLLVSLACLGLVRKRARGVASRRDHPDVRDEGSGLRARPATLLQEVREGLQGALATPGVRRALGVFVAANLAGTAPLLAGIPLRVTAEGWGAGAYGVVAAGLAVGSVVGLLALTRWDNRVTRAPLQVAGFLLLPGAIGVAGLTLAPTVLTMAAAAALVGLCFGPGARMVVGGIMRDTETPMMGRTVALVQFATYSGIPLGYVLYGAVANVSLAAAGLIMAAVLLVCGLVAARDVSPTRPA
ncbi:MAG: MFS transporter [Lapillicoccus sp.]